jgi:hypothetical protein
MRMMPFPTQVQGVTTLAAGAVAVSNGTAITTVILVESGKAELSLVVADMRVPSVGKGVDGGSPITIVNGHVRQSSGEAAQATPAHPVGVGRSPTLAGSWSYSTDDAAYGARAGGGGGKSSRRGGSAGWVFHVVATFEDAFCPNNEAQNKQTNVGSCDQVAKSISGVLGYTMGALDGWRGLSLAGDRFSACSDALLHGAFSQGSDPSVALYPAVAPGNVSDGAPGVTVAVTHVAYSGTDPHTCGMPTLPAVPAPAASAAAAATISASPRSAICVSDACIPEGIKKADGNCCSKGHLTYECPKPAHHRCGAMDPTPPPPSPSPSPAVGGVILDGWQFAVPR